ncbi:hypothetical protein Hanom_Chr04g00331771 [Helianthus anomalus]
MYMISKYRVSIPIFNIKKNPEIQILYKYILSLFILKPNKTEIPLVTQYGGAQIR